jgi:hypothetical protein
MLGIDAVPVRSRQGQYPVESRRIGNDRLLRDGRRSDQRRAKKHADAGDALGRRFRMLTRY